MPKFEIDVKDLKGIIPEDNSSFDFGDIFKNIPKEFTPSEITKNVPLFGGASFKNLLERYKLATETIERPIAGLRAVSKEGPASFMKGVKEPEKFPIGTFGESLTEAGLPPIAAGTLGTIADIGYYFALPTIVSKFAKSLTPIELEAKTLRRFDALFDNPKYQEAITNVAKKEGITLEQAHEGVKSFVSKEFKTYAYPKKLNVALGEAGFAGKGKALPGPEPIKPKGLIPTPLKPEITPIIANLKGEMAGKEGIFKSELDKAMKQPYEMTQEEFGNIPVIKYIRERLNDKKNPMTVSERNQLAKQLVDSGIMSIDAFNSMTGQHGFGGVVGLENLTTGKPIPSKPIDLTNDMGARINYIGQWHVFRTDADWFAHINQIKKAMEEGKFVPNKVLEEYRGRNNGEGDTGWADRELFKRKYEKQGITLEKKESVRDGKDEVMYSAKDKTGKIIARSDVMSWDKESEAIKQVEGDISKLSPTEGKIPKVPIPTQAKKEIEVKVTPKKAAVIPKTLTGRIKQGGGIDFSRDYNVKEIGEFGLKNTKGMPSPDQWARTLEEEGLITIPEDMNPGDYLMEQLKSKSDRIIPIEKSDLFYNKEYAKYLKTKADEVDVSFNVEKMDKQLLREKEIEINAALRAAGKSSLLLPPKTRQVIEETTGIKKLVETITIKEDVALREQLRTEARAAGKAYVAGKEEIRGINKIKKDTEEIATKLSNLSTRDLPPEYKNFIADELNSLGLLEGVRPLKAPKKLAEFVMEQRDKGELLLLSDEDIAIADYAELGNMTTDLLKRKYEILKQIAAIGSREKKLIAFGKEAALDETLDTIRFSINDNIGRRSAKETRGLTPSARKQSFVEKTNSSVDAFFAHLRKVEFISRTLDGWKDGPVQKEIIAKINKASDKEIIDNDYDFSQVKDFLKEKKFDIGKIISEPIDVNYNDKVKILTKMEMMGIYLNSLNDGNKFRLTNPEGWGLTEEQISDVISRLTSEEKNFANLLQKIASSRRDEMNTVKVALTGKEMGKVEGYWPIVADKELSARTRLREGEIDLFQDVINKTFVAKRMTETRTGGNAPVELDAFKVFLSHVSRVNHFNSHALAVRDIQKIIGSDKFRDAVISSMGENIYKQFQPWLRDIANPRQYVQDMAERWITRLRNNATSAVLGMKISVSLLQMGSYSQTINELGLADSVRGLIDFYHDPIGIANKINSLAPQMKYRGNSWDRDLKAFADSAAGRELIKGNSNARDALFALIQTFDRAATYPTWWSAYLKSMKQNRGNVDISSRYADGVVRRTQPAGMTKDLSAVMKGSAFKKLFTMFYTHFANYHNQMVIEFDKLKMGGKIGKNPLLRFGDFTVAHLWLTVIPALFAVWVKGGFKTPTKEDMVKGIASYGLGSIPIVRDVANAIIRRKPDPLTSPAFAGLQMAAKFGVEITKPLYGKTIKPKKLAETGLRTLGYGRGLPTEQAWVTLSGFMDFISGKTRDPRRLIFSPYALGDEKKKSYSNFGGLDFGELDFGGLDFGGLE